jgi:hypothetical protein
MLDIHSLEGRVDSLYDSIARINEGITAILSKVDALEEKVSILSGNHRLALFIMGGSHDSDHTRKEYVTLNQVLRLIPMIEAIKSQDPRNNWHTAYETRDPDTLPEKLYGHIKGFKEFEAMVPYEITYIYRIQVNDEDPLLNLPYLD